MKFIYLLPMVLFALAGCSLGPNYVAPSSSIPANWSKSSISNFNQIEGGPWWRNFNDPLLNELIEQGELYNLDLKIAKERVSIAQNEFAIATGQLIPVVNANALPLTATGAKLTQLIALSISFDPDLFGRLKQNRQRLLAYWQAYQAEQSFRLINLYAEIASNYLELREAQTKEKLFSKHIKKNKELLKLINSRYKAGYANYLNIAEQEALIATHQAELQQNKALIMAYIHKLELLTGNNPGHLTNKLLPFKTMPEMSKDLNLNLPSELLRRRGDIIAAERRVAAAHANTRVALASLFPQINVGWLLGWQTQLLASNILALNNPQSSFFGTFNAPILNISAYQNLSLRKKEKIMAVIEYQLILIKAFHEVETQYNYYQHYSKSRLYFKKALEKKRLVFDLSKDSYLKGRKDFTDLLYIEEGLMHLEIASLHNLVLQQEAKINLLKALGGGLTN
ncbi:MAG: efflux transporter outer membrane subunit [Proteobacteria bacterium]|nr:efflux transporter outer membrane subunit [Pseudomonadota bacterium]